MPPPESGGAVLGNLPDHIVAWRDSVLGCRESFRVGRIDPLWTQRYAVAVDDLDPLYFNEAAALERGLRGLIAPPNYIATQRGEASAGPAETLMKADGLPQAGGPPVVGLAAMGGGQEFEFHDHVYCGETILGEKEIVQVESRSGRSGEMVVVVEQIQYFSAAGGEAKLTLRNTVLYRLLEPVEHIDNAQ